MSTRELFVTSADGTKIWTEGAGDPTKPAVVLIHGLSCTALAFDKQFTDPSLLAGLHLVRYEMRGHGRSDMPAESIDQYKSVRHAEDFWAVCDAFGLVKPFLMATIAVDIVDVYGPSFLSGLIYIGGSTLTLRLNQQCLSPAFVAQFSDLLSTDAGVTARYSATFVDSCAATPIPWATKLQWIGGYAMQPPIVRQYSITREQDDARWLREVGILPALIIQGKEDFKCKGEKIIEQATGIFKDLEVKLMNDIGHAPHYETWEETNRLVLDFVQRKSQK